MDTDNSGSISLREINKLLMGDVFRSFTIEFDHPDTGIKWGFDSENCVAVTDVEQHSPAEDVTNLIRGLRVLRLNETAIPQHDSHGMEVLYQKLISIFQEKTEFEFLEPLFYINTFTCMLDIEVDDTLFSIQLPIGAYNDPIVLEDEIMLALANTHRSFSWIDVIVDAKSRQVTLTCEKYPFKMLFLTGPNFQRSCRYALGFAAEDTPLAFEHVGEPLVLNMHIEGISIDELTILTQEMFDKFDTDRVGKFDFEKFRNFYIKFLDTQASRDLLGAVAKHRFRDLEREKLYYAKQAEILKRRERRLYLQEKDGPVIQAQQELMRQSMFTGNDGMKRRIKPTWTRRLDAYRHFAANNAYGLLKLKREQQLAREAEAMALYIAAGSASASQSENGDEDQDAVSSIDDLPEANENLLENGSVQSKHTINGSDDKSLRTITTVKVRKASKGSKDKDDGSHSSMFMFKRFTGSKDTPSVDLTLDSPSQAQSQAIVPSVSTELTAKALAVRQKKEEADALKKKKAKFKARKVAKEKWRLQHAERTMKMREALATAVNSDKYAKKTQANDDEREVLGYVREVHEAIRRELKKNIEIAGENLITGKKPALPGGLPGMGGIPGMNFKQDIVKSPAAILGTGIFASKLSAGEIDMKTMSNRQLHPAVSQYFLVKKDMDKHPHPFEVWHPAFHGSDYIRFRSKHSSHAFRIMDMIEDQRSVGVKYRKKHGIKRVINVPPWDMPLVQSVADQKAEYREKVLTLESFVDENHNPYARHRSRNPKMGLVGNTSAVLLQQMRSLTRAEAPPVKKYRTDVIGKISILSMKVEGLPSMHLFKRNSLFVMCSCGEFRCTTEIHENAGSEAQWEDLKYWNMTLFKGSKLQLCVYSGDAYDHKLVGIFDIKTEDVADRPYVFKVNWEEQYENEHGETQELADIKRVKISDRDSSYGFVYRGGPDPGDLDDLDEANRNIACIESNIYNLNKDNMPKGSVKIVFSMEKGNPWEWKLRENREIERKKAKRRAKKKEEKRLRLLRARSVHDTLKKSEAEEDDEEDPNAPKVLLPLKIPYEALISKVSLFDIDLDKLKLSNISKCIFHLVAYCGDNQERTTVSVHNNEIIVDLHGNILSGHIALTDHAVADDAVHEAEDNLKHGMGEVSNSFKYNVNVEQNYVTIEWDDLLWTMFAGDPDDELVLQLVVFQPVDAHHLIMLHQKNEVNESLKDGKLVKDTTKKAPANILLRRVLGKYRYTAENWLKQPRNGAGITTLLGKVFTSEDETGAEIGTAGLGGAIAAGVDMNAEEFEEAREQGRRIRFKDQNPDDFLCKIRVISELTSTNYVDEEEQLVEFHEDEGEALELMRQNSAREPVEEATGISSTPGTPRTPLPRSIVPHFKVNRVLGGGNNFMSHDPNVLMYPFNVKVLSIAVYDLPSVHRFSKNAPCVRMRCNDWMDSVSNTTENGGFYSSDKGKSAAWEDLHWNFIVHQGNTVRITIYSGLVTIGELLLNTADTPEIKSKGIRNMSGDVATGEVVDFLRSNPIDMHGIMEINKSLVLYTRNQEDVVSPFKSKLIVGTEALVPIQSDVQKIRGKIRLKLKIVPHEPQFDSEIGLANPMESVLTHPSSVLADPESSPNPKDSAPLLQVPQSSTRVQQKYNARLLMNRLPAATLLKPYRLRVIDATVSSLRPPPERQVAPWLYPDVEEMTSRAPTRESPLKKSSVDFDGYVMGNSMAVTAATAMNPKRGYWGSNVNIQLDYFLHHLPDTEGTVPTVNLERWSENTFSGHDVLDFVGVEHDNKSKYESGEDFAVFKELNWMVDNIVPGGISVDNDVVSDVASMIQISVVRKCVAENTQAQMKSLEKFVVRGAITEREQAMAHEADRSLSNETPSAKNDYEVSPLSNVIVVGYCYVSVKKLLEMSYDVDGFTEFVSPIYVPAISFPGAKGPDVAKWKRRYPDARQQYPTLKKTHELVSQISASNIISQNEYYVNKNGHELDAHRSIFSEDSQYYSLPGAESAGIGRHKVKPAAMEMAGNIKLRIQFLPHIDDDPITSVNPEYNFNFNNAIITAEHSVVSSQKDDIAMQLTNTYPRTVGSGTLPLVPRGASAPQDVPITPKSSNIMYSQPRDTDYPFLTIVYSIILSNLRSVHALTHNTPSVKAFLGNRWRKSTDILEKSNSHYGNGYRWENLNWTMLMCHDYDLVHFKVTSGTILVGEYRLAAEPTLRRCPYGKYGISELNGVLLDGSNNFAGNMKLILRNEAVHPTNILGRRILSQLQKSDYQFPEDNANCALAVRMRESSMGWTGMPHKPKDPTRNYDENGADLGPKINLGIDKFVTSYPQSLNLENGSGTATGTSTVGDSASVPTYVPENRLTMRVKTAGSDGDLLRAWSDDESEEKLGDFAGGGGTGEHGATQAYIDQLVDHRNYRNNNETINKNHLNYHDIIANAIAAKTGSADADVEDSISMLGDGSVVSAIGVVDDLHSADEELSENSSVWRGRKIREDERMTELIAAGKYFGQENNMRTINYMTIKSIKVLDFNVLARNADVQVTECGGYEGLASQSSPSGLSVKLLSSVSNVVKKYQDAGNRVFVRVQCGDMWMEQTVPIEQNQYQKQNSQNKKRLLPSDPSTTAPLLWPELEFPEIAIEDKSIKLEFQILAFGTYACLGRYECKIQDITSIPRDNNGGITLFGDIVENISPSVLDRNLGYALINNAGSGNGNSVDPAVGQAPNKTFNFMNHAVSAYNNAIPPSPVPSVTSGTSTFVTASRKNVVPVEKVVGKLVLSLKWHTILVPINPIDIPNPDVSLSTQAESKLGENSTSTSVLNEYSSAAIDSLPSHHPPTAERPTMEVSVQGRPASAASSLLLHKLSHCDDYHIPSRCPIRLSIYSMFISSIPDAFVYTGTNAPLALPSSIGGVTGPKAVMFGNFGHQYGLDLVTSGGSLSTASFILTITSGISNAILFKSSVCRSTVSNSGVDDVGGTSNMLFWRNLDISLLTCHENDYILISLHQCNTNDITKNRPFSSASRSRTAESGRSDDPTIAAVDQQTDAIGNVKLCGSDLRNLPRDSRGVTELNLQLFHPTVTVKANTAGQGQGMGYGKSKNRTTQKLLVGELKLYCFCQSGDSITETRWKDQIKKSSRTRELLHTADDLLKIDEETSLASASSNGGSLSIGGDSRSSRHSKRSEHHHKHHHHKRDRFDESSIGDVKISSISLIDLPRIHKHFNNAPTVSLTCGAWHVSTQIQVNKASSDIITWHASGEDEIYSELWSFSEPLLSELCIIAYSGGIAFGYNSIPLREVLEVAKAYKDDVDSGTFQLRLYLVPIPAVVAASTATTRSSGTAYWQFGSKGKLLETAGEILINLDISRTLSSEEGNSLSTPRSYVAPMDQMQVAAVDQGVVVAVTNAEGDVPVNDDEDGLNSAAALTDIAIHKSNFHHPDASEGIGDVDDIVSLGAEIRVDDEDSLMSSQELEGGEEPSLELGEVIGEVDPEYRSPADEMISLLGLGGSRVGLRSSGQLIPSRSKSASGLSSIREGTPKQKRAKSVQISNRLSIDSDLNLNRNRTADGLKGIHENYENEGEVDDDDMSEDEEYEVDSENADFNFTLDDNSDKSSIDWAAKFDVPNNKLAEKYCPNLPKYEVYIEDLYTALKPANILSDFMKVRATRAVNEGPTMDGRMTARSGTTETAEFHKILRRMRSQSRCRMVTPTSTSGSAMGTGGFSPWGSRSGLFSHSGVFSQSGVFSRSSKNRIGSSGAFYDSFADGASSSSFGPFDSISSATSSRGTVLAQSSISSAESVSDASISIPVPVLAPAPKVMRVRKKRVRVSRPKTSRNIVEAGGGGSGILDPAVRPIVVKGNQDGRPTPIKRENQKKMKLKQYEGHDSSSADIDLDASSATIESDSGRAEELFGYYGGSESVGYSQSSIASGLGNPRSDSDSDHSDDASRSSTLYPPDSVSAGTSIFAGRKSKSKQKEEIYDSGSEASFENSYGMDDESLESLFQPKRRRNDNEDSDLRTDDEEEDEYVTVHSGELASADETASWQLSVGQFSASSSTYTSGLASHGSRGRMTPDSSNLFVLPSNSFEFDSASPCKSVISGIGGMDENDGGCSNLTPSLTHPSSPDGRTYTAQFGSQDRRCSSSPGMMSDRDVSHSVVRFQDTGGGDGIDGIIEETTVNTVGTVDTVPDGDGASVVSKQSASSFSAASLKKNPYIEKLRKSEADRIRSIDCAKYGVSPKPKQVESSGVVLLDTAAPIGAKRRTRAVRKISMNEPTPKLNTVQSVVEVPRGTSVVTIKILKKPKKKKKFKKKQKEEVVEILEPVDEEQEQNEDSVTETVEDAVVEDKVSWALDYVDDDFHMYAPCLKPLFLCDNSDNSIINSDQLGSITRLTVASAMARLTVTDLVNDVVHTVGAMFDAHTEMGVIVPVHRGGAFIYSHIIAGYDSDIIGAVAVAQVQSIIQCGVLKALNSHYDIITPPLVLPLDMTPFLGEEEPVCELISPGSTQASPSISDTDTASQSYSSKHVAIASPSVSDIKADNKTNASNSRGSTPVESPVAVVPEAAPRYARKRNALMFTTYEEGQFEPVERGKGTSGMNDLIVPGAGGGEQPPVEEKEEKEKIPSVPYKAEVTIHEVTGFQLSSIDYRMRPTRPYLMAKLKHATWKASTTPVVWAKRTDAVTEQSRRMNAASSEQVAVSNSNPLSSEWIGRPLNERYEPSNKTKSELDAGYARKQTVMIKYDNHYVERESSSTSRYADVLGRYKDHRPHHHPNISRVSEDSSSEESDEDHQHKDKELVVHDDMILSFVDLHVGGKRIPTVNELKDEAFRKAETVETASLSSSVSENEFSKAGATNRIYNSRPWDSISMRLTQVILFEFRDAGCGLCIGHAHLTYEEIMMQKVNHMKRIIETKAQMARAKRSGNSIPPELANVNINGDTNYVSCTVSCTLTPEYGGGVIKGVVSLHIDTAAMEYIMEDRTPEYWDEHRVEHWTNYPVPPISMGSIRQHYGGATKEYDKGMIMHPVFYGYSVRWKSKADEARFVHPIFNDYVFSRKMLTKRQLLTYGLASNKIRKQNPWKWDPSAAKNGKCPICSYGVDGCPRCYMLPNRRNGDKTAPIDFAYNPEADKLREKRIFEGRVKKERADAEQARLMSIFMRTGTKRKGLVLGDGSATNSSDSDSSSSSSSGSTRSSRSRFSAASSKSSMSRTTVSELPSLPVEEEEVLEIHTRMTSVPGIRMYRHDKMHMMTIFVKVMPAGFVTKLVMDANDTLFQLNNCYDCHCRFGNSNSRMLVLPTSTGIFELTGNISLETENLMEDYGGRCTIERFGLGKNCKNRNICLFSFAKYIPRNTQQLLAWYLAKNATYNTGDGQSAKGSQTKTAIPIYTSDQQMHKDVPNDPVQLEMLRLVTYEYYTQQLEQKKFFEDRAYAHRNSEEVKHQAFLKEKAEKKAQEEHLRRAEERRMESQLRTMGVSGAEYDAAKEKLMNRSKHKKGVVTEDMIQAALRNEERHKQHAAQLLQRKIIREYNRGGGDMKDVAAFERFDEAYRASNGKHFTFDFSKSTNEENDSGSDVSDIDVDMGEDEDDEGGVVSGVEVDGGGTQLSVVNEGDEDGVSEPSPARMNSEEDVNVVVVKDQDQDSEGDTGSEDEDEELVPMKSGKLVSIGDLYRSGTGPIRDDRKEIKDDEPGSDSQSGDRESDFGFVGEENDDGSLPGGGVGRWRGGFTDKYGFWK